MTWKIAKVPRAAAVGAWPGEGEWAELQAQHPDVSLPPYRPTVSAAAGTLIGLALGRSALAALLGGGVGLVALYAWEAISKPDDFTITPREPIP